MKLLLILGDQLFSPVALTALKPGIEGCHVFMREDHELATHYKYHKHKLILFFTAMRDYADELSSMGYRIHYDKLNSSGDSYEKSLENYIKAKGVTELEYFEIQDAFFEQRIQALCERLGIGSRSSESPMFLTSRSTFKTYLDNSDRPFMKTFYKAQRQRLKILVDDKGDPVGDRWSFDEENRLKLPQSIRPPEPYAPAASVHLLDVISLVNDTFPDHPGESSDFWLPTDRKGARAWLDDFLNNKFHDFGSYEDALPVHSTFVFHSVLTPFLNIGLLTPSEVVRAALSKAKISSVPLNSLEGFVRQIIGWREFIRGIYQNFRTQQEESNYWDHHRKLSHHWYEGTTGIPPLDTVIRKSLHYGYAHHIERLMVAGNLMLLLEIHPHEAHRWFMEMFVDSADWVMGPNVYGMAIFSDGGIFATKPYICGANYYRKMGTFEPGEWEDGVNGLYWTFIAKHRKFFEQNPRMAIVLGSLDRIKPERYDRLEQSANILRAKLTQGGARPGREKL